MKLKHLALIVTILPIVTIHLAYFVSASQQLVPSCIPYIEGCTSISRAGRNGDAIFIFRAGMMVNAVLLAFFWWKQKQALLSLSPGSRFIPFIVGWLGMIGAAFFLLYVDFLGYEGDFYRSMRRLGIVVFFSFTYIAQLLTLKQYLAAHRRRHKALYFQLFTCAWVLLVGLASLFLEQLQLKSFTTENIAEWQATLLLDLFFLGSYFLALDKVHKRL